MKQVSCLQSSIVLLQQHILVPVNEAHTVFAALRRFLQLNVYQVSFGTSIKTSIEKYEAT